MLATNLGGVDLDKDYIYEGMILYNLQGREIVVKKVEWKDEDKVEGYIEGYFIDNLSKGNSKISRFSTNTMGEFLFYELEEIQWRNNVDVLKNIPKYAKYSIEVKKIIRKEQEDSYHSMQKMISRNKLHDNLKHKYNFDGFIHTTDFTNFISIMDKGYIYSRHKVENENLINIDSANKTVINNTSKYVQKNVRFYYRPKTPTHYRNEGIRPGNPQHHMPIPVMLVAGRDIYNYKDMFYTDGNAGSSTSKKTDKVQNVYRYNLDRIFSQGDYSYLTYEEKKETTRQRNAELLVPDEVSIKDINKIIFRSNADLKMAKILFGNDSRFIVDKSKFYNEFQYCDDYLIVVDNNILSYSFKLNKYDACSISQYSHALRCKFGNLLYKYDLIKNMSRIVPKSDTYNIIGTINIGQKCKNLKSVEYLINGHVSAIWRE